jgi:hypothetical protein
MKNRIAQFWYIYNPNKRLFPKKKYRILAEAISDAETMSKSFGGTFFVLQCIGGFRQTDVKLHTIEIV